MDAGELHLFVPALGFLGFIGSALGAIVKTGVSAVKTTIGLGSASDAQAASNAAATIAKISADANAVALQLKTRNDQLLASLNAANAETARQKAAADAAIAAAQAAKMAAPAPAAPGLSMPILLGAGGLVAVLLLTQSRK